VRDENLADASEQPDRDVEPRLVAALEELAREFGALGVALAAADRTDHAVLVQRLSAQLSEASSVPRPTRPARLNDAVHYRSYGSADDVHPAACRAAIVTAVDEDPRWSSVAVLNPTGMFFDDTISYDPNVELGGTWHWAEDCGA